MFLQTVKSEKIIKNMVSGIKFKTQVTKTRIGRKGRSR